jgi:hypothetical protein
LRVHKLTKLRRDNILKIQGGAEDIGFAKEAKAETFGTWKIFQGK